MDDLIKRLRGPMAKSADGIEWAPGALFGEAAKCIELLFCKKQAAIEKIEEIIEGQRRESNRPFSGNTYSATEACQIIKEILC